MYGPCTMGELLPVMLSHFSPWSGQDFTTQVARSGQRLSTTVIVCLPHTMPSVPLHTGSNGTSPTLSRSSPLPQLLNTPNGLAIIEIQGTLNMPQANNDSAPSQPIGRLVIPNQEAGAISDTKEGAWMKKVYFYVGQNQRLVGQVQKLAKPLGVLRKAGDESGMTYEGSQALEISDIVRWKIFFGGRPEFV